MRWVSIRKLLNLKVWSQTGQTLQELIKLRSVKQLLDRVRSDEASPLRSEQLSSVQRLSCNFSLFISILGETSLSPPTPLLPFWVPIPKPVFPFSRFPFLSRF